MSVLARFIPNITTNLQRFITHALIPKANFHALSKEIPSITYPSNPFDMTTRNIVRCHFPRPSERKRIKRHGYWKRMSTEAGRRIIMRKILKGKHVLSH